jgi:uncharacterized protein
MKNYHHYYYDCWHYSKIPLYIMITIGMVVVGELSLLQAFDLYKVINVFAYTQDASSTIGQNLEIAQGISATAQGLTSVNGFCDPSTTQPHATLTVNKVVLNSDGTTRYNDQQIFRVNVGNNILSGGSTLASDLSVPNPLSICLIPGSFFVVENALLPPGFQWAAPVYQTAISNGVPSTTADRCFLQNVQAGQQITCTISNRIISTGTNQNIISAPSGIQKQTASTPTVRTAQDLGLSSPKNNTITINNNTTTLSVLGMASTNIKPDKVSLSFGIETTNKTADAALSTNSKAMNKVLVALREAGVKENESSTSSFAITPNYNYSRSASKGDLTGFTVINSIKVEGSNTAAADLSKWIDSAIAAGANKINDINLRLSDKKLEDTKKALLGDAIKSAKDKADIAASSIGLRVIGVKSMNLDALETSILQPSPLFGKAQGLSTGSDSSPTILSGQQQVSAKVGIVFLVGL